MSSMPVEMKIYLASSWRNPYHAEMLTVLRNHGFAVYDFKNPVAGNQGFSWKAIREDLHTNLTAEVMRETLAHPIAERGFQYDFQAMQQAHGGLLLLPCGRSAHLEAGWLAGRGRPVVVCAPKIDEPELMYKIFEERSPLFATTPIFTSMGAAARALAAAIQGRSTYGDVAMHDQMVDVQSPGTKHETADDWRSRPGWPAWSARHGRQCGARGERCPDRAEHERGPAR